MSVPKKCTSISKGYTTGLKVFSLAESILTGNSKDFFSGNSKGFGSDNSKSFFSDNLKVLVQVTQKIFLR